MVTRIYVFIDGLEESPVLCGELSLNPDRTTKFKYFDCYLANPDAFPLDPLNLPLGNTVYHSDAINSTFGVFTDAGADTWGKKILYTIHTTKPQNILEYLLAYSGTGVGCLRFSLSRNSVKPRQYQNKIEDIPKLITAKNKILSDVYPSQVSASVLSAGLGIGGARPKAVVTIDGIDYIAKFQWKDDKFNHVRVEHSTMSMLQKVTANVAQTQILEDMGEDVLLVKRFDLDCHRPSHHFISGHSIINMNRVKESIVKDRYSYGFLAEFLLKYSAEPLKDAEELFKRMVFNVLINNTDDHPRNHAFLYSFKEKTWRLSPAYDVLPISSSGQHGIGIGGNGREGTVKNILSQNGRFSLSDLDASHALNCIRDVVGELYSPMRGY